MTYDPLAYWEERARANGETYVAKGNAREHFDREWREFEPALRTLMPPFGAGRLLDFGCGSGRFTELLSGLSSSYVGGDIITEGLTLAQKEYPENTFWLIEDGKIPVADEFFDTIVAVFVLQHMVTDYDAWCAEFARVLRPGGCIVAIDRDPFPGESPLAHMKPRGSAALEAATGCELKAMMVPNADHWAARFVKR